MTLPPIIGLTGPAGAGKNTVLERLQALFGMTYQGIAFADKLKESAAALFNVNAEMLEAWKNEPSIRVTVLDTRGAGRDLGRSFSVREMLQRFGTEAGRHVYGEDFWVERAMDELQRKRHHDAMLRQGPFTYVFTDVRFDNEAEAIIERGGVMVEVVGPTSLSNNTHASERGVDGRLISRRLRNTERPAYEVMSSGDPAAVAAEQQRCREALDDEVARVHAELSA